MKLYSSYGTHQTLYEYVSSNEEFLLKVSKGEQLTPKEKIRLKKLQEAKRKHNLNKKK